MQISRHTLSYNEKKRLSDNNEICTIRKSMKCVSRRGIKEKTLKI